MKPAPPVTKIFTPEKLLRPRNQRSPSEPEVPRRALRCSGPPAEPATLRPEGLLRPADEAACRRLGAAGLGPGGTTGSHTGTQRKVGGYLADGWARGRRWSGRPGGGGWRW